MPRQALPIIVNCWLVHWHRASNICVSMYGENVSLLRDEGQVQAHWRWQQNIHQHIFPVIVGGDLVHCTVLARRAYGTHVSLLRDEGQVPTDSRRQQNMHRHEFSVVVNGEVVQWHGACNVYLFRKRYLATRGKCRRIGGGSRTCIGTNSQSS